MTAQFPRHYPEHPGRRAMRDVAQRYEGRFDIELPHTMCVQEARASASDWRMNVEFLPPHRSAERLTARASLVTALGVYTNDTVPDRSAERMGRSRHLVPTGPRYPFPLLTQR